MADVTRVTIAPVRGELVAHFESLPKQAHAARFGMWIFLGTEVLLFTGLFVAFAYYRAVYTDTFTAAARHLSVVFGTLMTVLLVTSSLFVALAQHWSAQGRRAATVLSLAATLALGLAFLGLKGAEWGQHLAEGYAPGRFYANHDFVAPGASLFFSLYYLMSGLHALHVIAGLCVIAWLMWRASRAEFVGLYQTPLEMGALYWHLVEVIWLFLYPLLYLL